MLQVSEAGADAEAPGVDRLIEQLGGVVRTDDAPGRVDVVLRANAETQLAATPISVADFGVVGLDVAFELRREHAAEAGGHAVAVGAAAAQAAAVVADVYAAPLT